MYSGNCYPVFTLLMAAGMPPQEDEPCSSCEMQPWCQLLREDGHCKGYRPAGVRRWRS